MTPQANQPDPESLSPQAAVALLEVAVEAARAGAVILRERAPHVRDVVWQSKGASDFVSEVDLAAEARIAASITRRLPRAVVAGEEESPDAYDAAGLVFVVDPLDGTTNYLHGYPEYAVSIGVMEHGVLAAAVVHNAATGEEFTATRGGGAWRGAERLRVSAITDPTRALIGTGFPFKYLEYLDDYQRQFAAIASSTAGIRRAGSAALDLCDVACGRFDAFWEHRLAPWDLAAGVLLIREAGGRVTTFTGADAPVAHGPIVASNGLMHEWFLDILAGDDGAGDLAASGILA